MPMDVKCRAMRQKKITKFLKGGDRRSIGRADQLVKMVHVDPSLFTELLKAMWSGDPVVRMRAADATEKITRENPGLIAAHKKELLGLAAEAKAPELCWHLAVMLPRLTLTAGERKLAITILNDYLEMKSSIVKTFALQGLADMAKGDPKLREILTDILRQATRTGTPAMKSRSRRLLLQLENY